MKTFVSREDEAATQSEKPATCKHCGEAVKDGADAVRHVHRHIKERVDAKFDAEEAQANAVAVGDAG